jgi:hypothetical protein
MFHNEEERHKGEVEDAEARDELWGVPVSNLHARSIMRCAYL